MDIRRSILSLSANHQMALKWFEENHHAINIPYTPKYNGVSLVSPARGIFKSKDDDYAYSVKQTLKGYYPDQDPYVFADGSAVYAYHQEGEGLADRLGKSSNIAVDKNIQDGIPLGVLIQTQEKGREGAKYSIYLALPLGWIDGFYILYIAPPTFILDETILQMSLVDLLALVLEPHQVQANENEHVFDPENIVDGRKKTLRAISQRQGQPKFRRKLMAAYNKHCSISACQVEVVLEAAHITPYLGTETNVMSNGLLLRSDLHILWDRYLLTIEANTYLIKVHPDLLCYPEYSQYHNQQMHLPIDQVNYPSMNALRYHNDLCGFL